MDGLILIPPESMILGHGDRDDERRVLGSRRRSRRGDTDGGSGPSVSQSEKVVAPPPAASFPSPFGDEKASGRLYGSGPGAHGGPEGRREEDSAGEGVRGGPSTRGETSQEVMRSRPGAAK